MELRSPGAGHNVTQATLVSGSIILEFESERSRGEHQVYIP